MKISPAITLTILSLTCALPAAKLPTVDSFQEAAAKANAVLTIPTWEQTPAAVEASVNDAIAKANAALDEIGTQDLAKVTFESTVVALDDLVYQAGLATNRAVIIQQSNPEAAMRSAAEGDQDFPGLGRRHRLPRGCLSRDQSLRENEAEARRRR